MTWDMALLMAVDVFVIVGGLAYIFFGDYP